jgi:methylglyoxal synthase
MKTGRVCMRELNDIKKQKHIALVAHDGKKIQLINWIKVNRELLSNHFLCGTGTTARMIIEETSLPIMAFESGPLGGDQQIGASIVEGKIDFMIFFWDPLSSQPHDPDVKALLRIAVLYDIPVAMNASTADFLLKSSYMDEDYIREEDSSLKQ